MTAARLDLGRGWTLWPHALVRGAGFPFARLDEALRSPAGEAALWDVAADPRFREAVTWQNRPAVANGLDSLLRRPRGTRDARTRKTQLVVVKYLQRYCAKNDTIGFFGPVGWATVGGTPRFAAGPSLIAARATFFEPWAVRAVACAAGGHGSLDAPVRLPGHLRLGEATVRGPDTEIPLGADELRVVRAADGGTAAALLQALGDGPWRDVLDRLVADGILRWELPVSVSLAPERSVRAAGGAAAVDALYARRDAVAQAAGDPAALGEALIALEAAFEAQTGASAWRSPGQTYAGRGLVFEECRRAISLDLGQAPLARVAPALQLLLRVARWYTFSIATDLARALVHEHQQLGGGAVPLHVFWRRTEALFDQQVPAAVAAAAAALRAQWSALWAQAETRPDGQYLTVEAAESFIAQHLEAPCPGWPSARHHAPDLMWAVPSPEALLAGEGTPVLAELHPGVTPFTTLSVLSLCPVREALVAEWDADFPEPLASPVPWEDFARSTHDARLAARHWHIDLGTAFVSDRPADQVLRAADFDVVSRDGQLRAVHRGGGPDLDLFGVFERRIKLRAAVGFSLAGDADAGPRRYLGPLLVQRAYRRVEVLPFLDTKADRPARVAAWREALGLPERVFVRSPAEVKPVYVDLASPVSVEMLVRLARQAPHLSISEMFPGPDGLWLRDGAGDAYTAELRFIAVDPQPYDGAQVWGQAAHG
jgi:hypothetical protein